MATQKERRAAPRKPGTKADPTAGPNPPVQARGMPGPEDIRHRIEMAAYLRAKQRGFAPGYELDDWLKAEAEVKNRLLR